MYLLMRHNFHRQSIQQPKNRIRFDAFKSNSSANLAFRHGLNLWRDRDVFPDALTIAPFPPSKLNVPLMRLWFRRPDN
jgi:hypothetical protein